MNPFVLGAGSGIVGQYLYEEWIMPTISRNGVMTDPRPVVAGAPVIQRPSSGPARTIQLTPVDPQPVFEPALEPRRLPSFRAPIGGRSAGGLAPPGGPSGQSGANTPPSTNDPGSIIGTPTRRYPGNDPLSILADVLGSMFGPADQFNSEPQYSVVPQVLDEGGGGGNVFLILAVLAAAGFGIYYFYFR